MLELLQLDDLIDLAIPRGGEGLIRFVAEHARVPVIKHYKGVCHLYVDAAADPVKALDLLVDGKGLAPGRMQRAGDVAGPSRHRRRVFMPLALDDAWPSAASRCAAAHARAPGGDRGAAAEDADYAAEYLDLILAVRVVDGLDEALAHIARYGSDHTEVIVTERCRCRRGVHRAGRAAPRSW